MTVAAVDGLDPATVRGLVARASDPKRERWLQQVRGRRMSSAERREWRKAVRGGLRGRPLRLPERPGCMRRERYGSQGAPSNPRLLGCAGRSRT